MSTAYHELYWSYSVGLITYEQLQAELEKLNKERMELEREVC